MATQIQTIQSEQQMKAVAFLNNLIYQKGKKDQTLIIKDSPAVVLESIKKTYGKGDSQVTALRGIDLLIPRSQIVTIMGPSGSGKSSLLNILGAMDYVTEGRVIVDGTDITNIPEKKLAEFRRFSIGYIFQDFYLIPNMSVIDNVLAPLIPYGISKKDRAYAQELLDLVGLGERANSKVNKLSGGQMQRVAIARALINNPKIILADEPTGNLDSETGREIISLLMKLTEQGKTVIIVTHDPRIANRVKRHPKGRNIWIEDGRLSDQPIIDAECS